LVRPKDAEKLVKVDDFDVDLTLNEHFGFFRYEDRPGVVGVVGQILGEHGINIAGMQVARATKGGQALVALTVDSAIAVPVLETIVEKIGAASGRAVDLVEV
jgi:D-3-phosphoglycerate dehydrogenase / 2-oxoglutarate reductase